MSDLKTLKLCPACRQKTLVDHCDPPRCGWTHCRSKPCDGMFDLSRGRGHVLSADGNTRSRWSPPPPVAP
jgi:hypothetical protein